MESKYTQTVCQKNSEFIEDNLRHHKCSNEGLFYWSSIPPNNQILNSDTDLYSLLSQYMRQLENQGLQLIGVEQQIQSLSNNCRSISEQIVANTNAIHSIINELVSKNKETALKQSQTNLEDNQSVSNYFKSNESIEMPSLKSNTFILSDRKDLTKINLSENHFNELSEDMKNRFNRLPAMIKGYLTRRLMKTQKVLDQINTIRDTTQLLSNYSKKETDEDLNFHKNLRNQLKKSCQQLYDFFFNISKSSQMVLIQNSRQHILERHYRNVSLLTTSGYMESSFKNKVSPQKNVSSVTKKIIQRKTQKSKSNATQPNNHSFSKKLNSPLKRLRTLGLEKMTEKANTSVRRSQRNGSTNSSKRTNL